MDILDWNLYHKENVYSIFDHIETTWDKLTKDTKGKVNKHVIVVPNKFIVPGGRFSQFFYWDSYFTFLGLDVVGKHDMIEGMIENFAYIIDEYGHIPNGNRKYWLSRSQIPFFSSMVELLSKIKNDKSIITKYTPQIRKEYDFWMQDDRNINGLGRYWDSLDKPRPESYFEDVETKKLTNRDNKIYRDIRAACESGWDFSSRWLEDKYSLTKINTTDILPVDLNCMLFHMESILSIEDKSFVEKANKRRLKIIDTFWNDSENFFYDYNFVKNEFAHESLAGLFPLYMNMVDQETADKVLSKIKDEYLFDGGLVSTLYQTGQQWDYANGWAPLQWIGFKAAMNYGNKSLAKEIAVRWINVNERLFLTTGKMYEKYDVVNIKRIATGGEYFVQEGFGWTNGVFLKMYNELINEKI